MVLEGACALGPLFFGKGMEMDKLFLKKCLKCGTDFYEVGLYRSHIETCKGPRARVGETDHEPKAISTELAQGLAAKPQQRLADMAMDDLRAHAAKKGIAGADVMGRSKILSTLADLDLVPASPGTSK